jgi:aquaporin Z
VIGGIVAGVVIYVIASGKHGWSAEGNMAANGYGDHSPGGYSLVAVLVTEIVLTAVFLLVILGATDDRAPKGFAAWRLASPSPSSTSSRSRSRTRR